MLNFNTFVANEGTWVWYHSGESLTENSWGPGRPRPDENLEHDCGALVLETEDSYYWDDINCFPVGDALGAPICQHGTTSTGSTTPSPITTSQSGSTPSGECPSGWLDYGGNAYCVHADTATWSEAEAACVSQGGHLTSIHSDQENSFLGSATNSNSFWIGANDEASEGSWTWADGSTFDYSVWGDGQPNGGDQENCGYVSSGVLTWQDYSCATSLIYVCEVIGGGGPTSEQPSTTSTTTTTTPATTTEKITTAALGPCSTGWQELDGHSYCVHTETLKWDEAESTCVDQGAHLASITSDAENSFVGGLVSTGFWVGGTDEASEGTWTWSDGANFSFTKWGSNQPQDSKYDNCIWVFPESYDWADFNCQALQPFVCKV